MNKPINIIIVIQIIIASFCGLIVKAQNYAESREGKVSYITSQNVYIKFPATEGISIGDTLFATENSQLIAALIVKNISSISCVCVPAGSRTFTVGESVVAKTKGIKPVAKSDSVSQNKFTPTTGVSDSVKTQKIQPKNQGQDINGNITVASYLNFSNSTANSQRMRYTLAFNADNIGNSKLSAETYISFVHKINQWSEIQEDVFNGLKIYNLSINYKFNKHHQVWFGRKINPRISNAGAIDGLQYEFQLNSFSVGIIGGTRPDYRNYSFNANLAQFGGYLGHDLAGKNGNMQTTLAFMQQMNNGVTDRRFAYLQHVNALVKNLYFFGSVEVDFYKKTMNTVDSTFTQDNSPKLSNLYLSLRYRPVKMLSFTLSYSARQNVIYYETYKDIVATLLEAATVQGFIFQINVRPGKNLSIGVNTSYRDSKNDPKPTKSLYMYLTLARIPGIEATGTLSATLLETGYMSGKIYSAGLSRDLINGKLNAGLGYRFVDYSFFSGESRIYQHIPEFNLTWRILKKLSCSLFYEGTFDKTSTFNRIYVNFTQRF
ncbi:MAG: hypothetical protein WCP32_06810 [Bacteroidota bacterium]